MDIFMRVKKNCGSCGANCCSYFWYGMRNLRHMNQADTSKGTTISFRVTSMAYAIIVGWLRRKEYERKKKDVNKSAPLLFVDMTLKGRKVIGRGKDKGRKRNP